MPITIGHIMNGIPTSTSSSNKEIKYMCETEVQLLSPVTGTISDVGPSSIQIKSSDTNIFTIAKVSFDTPKPTVGLTVNMGFSLSAKTAENKVFLSSSQDLSYLLVKPEKEETSKKLSSGLGMTAAEAADMAKRTLKGTIGVSNAPYQKILDALKFSKVVKEESNEIKDNVLSEELKRIKSLF